MHKKNKILNIVMVAAIAVIAASGIFTVGKVKGWFSKDKSVSNAVISECDSIASIERDGLAYSPSDNMELKDGDILDTRSGVGITISACSNEIVLDENTQAEVKAASDTEFSLGISKGKAFISADSTGCIMSFDNDELEVRDAVISISVQDGSSDVNVYAGQVSFKSGDDEKTADAGEKISIVDESGISTSELTASSLSKFDIENAERVGVDRNLCFSNDELEKILSEREEEVNLAEKDSSDNEKSEMDNNETSKSDNNETSKGEADASDSQEKASVSAENSADEAAEKKSQEDNKKTESKGQDNSSSIQNAHTCTIAIRCDTILNNMESLDSSKKKYVPKNGVILSTTKVEFSEGETAFDVLKRTCNNKGIQLEYSWTPGYNSYYVEGIGNLYEFDCGSQSGWTYKVNGWFPNYGMSSYALKDGDAIVLCYTCKGLGADVGGGV